MTASSWTPQPLPAKVRAVLDLYQDEPIGVRRALAALLSNGRLAGTGKLLILPIDQGYEHGAARSFAANPAAYDPLYHGALALDAGFSAYAASLGSLRVMAAQFPQVPLIAKLNGGNPLKKPLEPLSCTAAPVEVLVDQACALGCIGVGYTIYYGSGLEAQMIKDAGTGIALAKERGMLGIVWAYPRGGDLGKDGPQALDVTDLAVRMTLEQTGAHLVKIKPPTAAIFLEDNKKAFENIAKETLAERVAHLRQAAFGGRRLIIFSGMAKESDDAVVQTASQLAAGGAAGMIMGRNSFQRSKADATALVERVAAEFAKVS